MSNSSANQQNSATRGGQGSIATPANSGGSSLFGGTGVGASHARRSSQEAGSGKFGNLSSLKRNSQDQGAVARKNSLSEQAPAPGVIGKMWNSWTKGDNK